MTRCYANHKHYETEFCPSAAGCCARCPFSSSSSRWASFASPTASSGPTVLGIDPEDGGDALWLHGLVAESQCDRVVGRRRLSASDRRSWGVVISQSRPRSTGADICNRPLAFAGWRAASSEWRPDSRPHHDPPAINVTPGIAESSSRLLVRGEGGCRRISFRPVWSDLSAFPRGWLKW